MPVCMSLTVYYAAKGRQTSFCTLTRDLSFEGAFIEAGEARPAKGIIVRLVLERSFIDPLTIDALVVRNHTDGFGVTFVDDGDEVVKQLTPILQPMFNRRYKYGRR